jgi:hypothetical protein
LYSKREPKVYTNAGTSPDFSLNLQTWAAQKFEAADVEQELGYPVICGVEVAVAETGEEVVVIGTSAIDMLFKIRERKFRIDIENLKGLRKNFECVINLCHPGDGEKFRTEGGVSILSAYEFIHTGSPMFTHREDPYESSGLVQLCNSDAHHARLLYRCANRTEIPLTTETDIIRYIKAKLPIGFHIEPHRPTKEIFANEVF